MSRSTLLAVGLITAFGFGSSALAESAPLAGQAPTPSSQTQRPTARAGQSGIKPGDRMCVRHTGSLIPPKQGKCLPVAGRSYSAEDLQRTGSPNTATALQMLDPRIRVGH
jgi:hypothetical protein